LQPSAPGEPERAGNREHRVRRRGGGRRPHQSRRPAARGTLSDDQVGERRRARSATCEALIMATTTQRIYNFSAGPAVLPPPVLEEAQRDLVSLPGVGMSILENSHRSKAIEADLHGAEADIRGLAGIPEDYAVLVLQGGASLQFSMVPMNLLTEGGSADYV